MRVLILNHQYTQCGVYQFGKRIFDLVNTSNKVKYFYASVSNHKEYELALNKYPAEIIIYNWHWDRMPWLRNTDIIKNKKSKHYFIFHDGSIMSLYDKYLFFGNHAPFDKSIPDNKKIILPRPLFDYNGNYPINRIPVIGSFGFAFTHKRFPELVQLINKTFDSAVINIHMTSPYFGDSAGGSVSGIKEQCLKKNTNKNITLNITNNFITNDQELLCLLAKNDINVLNYENNMHNPGLSSALDYLLSVKRPIAITSNQMFRHIIKNDILIDRNTLQEILKKGIKPLEKYYCEWDTEVFRSKFDTAMLKI